MVNGGANLTHLVRRAFVASSLVLVLGLTIAATWSKAIAAEQPSGQGLEISPPVIELKANPGQTVTATIRIRNVTSQEVIARGQVNDFKAGGEEGQPSLDLNSNEVTNHSLRPWIKSVPDIRLQKLELKTISIPIEVPRNASPGGHYGVIRFTAIPPDLDGTGVALSASLGSLVLVDVAGDKVENASVITFLSSYGGKPGSFFENGPISFVERIQNSGTVHIKPVGTVDIYNTFGRKVESLNFVKTPNNILPDSVRRYEQTWNKRFLFGRYRANVNLTYGDSGKALTKSIVFWVIPWKLILFVLIALIALFFVIRQSIRNYNRRVIEKYRRRN